MSLISWPDIFFGPVNLWTMPKAFMMDGDLNSKTNGEYLLMLEDKYQKALVEIADLKAQNSTLKEIIYEIDSRHRDKPIP